MNEKIVTLKCPLCGKKFLNIDVYYLAKKEKKCRGCKVYFFIDIKQIQIKNRKYFDVYLFPIKPRANKFNEWKCLNCSNPFKYLTKRIKKSLSGTYIEEIRCPKCKLINEVSFMHIPSKEDADKKGTVVEDPKGVLDNIRNNHIGHFMVRFTDL